MTKLQLAVFIAAVALLALLYLGFDRKPKTVKDAEKTRVLAVESTDINILLAEAKKTLKVEEANTVLVLEQQLALADNDSLKSNALKELSGGWYRIGKYALAGYFAQQVAELEDTEDAWSIAGTSYAICVQKVEDEKTKQFCTNRAAEAFENATSVNPANLQHQVNLSLVYLENPPKQNPMQGVQILLDLNKKYPKDVLVLLTLARQGMRTGQYEKATERLSNILAIEPDNVDANCLLAQVYEQLNRPQEAQPYINRCKSLIEK